MSSANFFGTDSPLVNLFLETYDGDYTKAPSGENLRKIMMAKTYNDSADADAIAPQFMELIVSAADTWRKLDRYSSDSDRSKKQGEIRGKLEKFSDVNDPLTDSGNAFANVNDALAAYKKAIKDALGTEDESAADALDETGLSTVDGDKLIKMTNGQDNSTELPIVLNEDGKAAIADKATENIKPAVELATNAQLKTSMTEWSSDGKNLEQLQKEIRHGSMKGLSMDKWSNIAQGEKERSPIGKFDNETAENWRYNLKKDHGTILFAHALPALDNDATFNGKKITSLSKVFLEIQGLAPDNSADSAAISSLEGMTLTDVRTAAKKAEDEDVNSDSNLFTALINNVSAEDPRTTINDSMFKDQKNDMANMKIGRDKDGLYYRDDDDKISRNWNQPKGELAKGISECIIKGDKVGLAKCLEGFGNFYDRANKEMEKMDPKTILYMCQKLELVKKSVKLEGTNIVVKVPCPFDEWMQYLESKPEHHKYVMTLKSPLGNKLQEYIKGVIEYLTKEKRILNEKLTDEVYSEKVEAGLKVGTKDGKDRMIPRFVVPEGLKERMSQSKDLYGSHMITHQGQNVRFPIYQNMYLGQSGGSTAASFIQTGGDYDKSRQSSVHEHTLKKIMTNLETVGFTVKEADHKQIEKYISDLRDTEDKLEKLFTIMKKFESLARSYGYDELLRSEDDLDVQSLDFSKITNQKDMKAYLYNSIKDVKSVMNQSVKLQNTMNNNLQKHVFSRLLSAVSPSNKDDYEKFN